MRERPISGVIRAKINGRIFLQDRGYTIESPGFCCNSMHNTWRENTRCVECTFEKCMCCMLYVRPKTYMCCMGMRENACAVCVCEKMHVLHARARKCVFCTTTLGTYKVQRPKVREKGYIHDGSSG